MQDGGVVWHLGAAAFGLAAGAVTFDGSAAVVREPSNRAGRPYVSP